MSENQTNQKHMPVVGRAERDRLGRFLRGIPTEWLPASNRAEPGTPKADRQKNRPGCAGCGAAAQT